MLTIGDFSKLCRVPIATLRYYDVVGLLTPVKVDPFTSYRYYSVSQLPRLNRLLALKDLGFSLEQIGQVLNERPSLEELRGMLRLKRAEIQQRVADEQARLERVEARLQQIEREGKMSNYDVVVKTVEPQLVASMRQVIPHYQDVGRLYPELMAHIAAHGQPGLAVAIWHEEGFKAENVDAEALVYLKTPVPEAPGIRVYNLPGGPMASVVHYGAYQSIGQAYDALVHWVETNGYRIVGPNRELYLHATMPVRQDDESYVTELQFPVEKV